MKGGGIFQMHNRRSFTKRLIGSSFAVTLATVLAGVAAVPASAQYRYNPEHRRPLERTLVDLRGIAERNTYNGHEAERYNNAIRHLEQFRDRLHEGGRFDKDKLDEAIGDVQSVIDHNPMGPEAREFLVRDVNELRRLREHYDERYRYPY
jgi:hypothetical protein